MVNDRSGGSSQFMVNDRSQGSQKFQVKEGTGASSEFMVNDRSMGSDAFNLPGNGMSIGAQDFAVALGNKGSDPKQFY